LEKKKEAVQQGPARCRVYQETMFGRRGTRVVTLLRAILLVVLQDPLNQLHVTACKQYLWAGTLFLCAAALYSIHDYGRKGCAGHLH
jgi:hypothetical protein